MPFNYRGLARIFYCYEIGESDTFACGCGWVGTFGECSNEYFRDLMDGSCPKCDTMLVVKSFPTDDETRTAASAGDPRALEDLSLRQQSLPADE